MAWYYLRKTFQRYVGVSQAPPSRFPAAPFAQTTQFERWFLLLSFPFFLSHMSLYMGLISSGPSLHLSTGLSSFAIECWWVI